MMCSRCEGEVRFLSSPSRFDVHFVCDQCGMQFHWGEPIDDLSPLHRVLEVNEN
jgi:hypothetical protein